MPISFRSAAAAAAALVLTLAAILPADAQEQAPRSRIDLVPLLGYAHGGARSRDAFVAGFRIGIGTDRLGIAYTQELWLVDWPCPRTADVCDDAESHTLGVERRFAGAAGSALDVGVDAGVLSWYGAHPMGAVRLGAEQGIGRVALRAEAQAQTVPALHAATVGLFLGLRISFPGPPLPHR
jgi:hypothetical protein